MKVKKENNKIIITENACNKGEKYAIQEIKNPVRILTTTVFVDNGEQILLPVRSEKGIHKNLIVKGIKKLSKIKVNAPIKQKDVIYENILESRVNIIASRDIDKKNPSTE
jgi:CxxC motif-containing protein